MTESQSSRSQSSIRATVCQLPPGGPDFEAAWRGLCSHVADQGSDLVLLPEMPFHEWLARTADVDAERWGDAVEAHDRWLARLGELGASVVVGSRPVGDRERRNRAFVWTLAGPRDLHDKVYLPNEDGFWEATWYDRGEPAYEVTTVSIGGRELQFGVLLCTELWFLEHARAYGRGGAQLLLVPRATPRSTLQKWIVGGKAAAVVSGAYTLSASCAEPGSGELDLGGGSLAVNPDGELLGATSESEPWITIEIDLEAANRAKETYPRYVPEA
ncbi:MAG: carbon-nitrogen hydrolase family protein [Acidobacteria bacterium]|nr:carbon-nitrogen hydrolase family protein [Acidobacteriota bacterium]